MVRSEKESVSLGICGFVIISLLATKCKTPIPTFAIIIVELLVTGVMHYEIMGGCFIMLATAFYVKFFALRKKHELVVAICYTLIAIGWLTFWILRLTKVI